MDIILDDNQRDAVMSCWDKFCNAINDFFASIRKFFEDFANALHKI